MWSKPYKMKEGFLIGGGLILAGLILQVSIGPVVWNTFRWPVNGIMLAVLFCIIATIFLLSNKVKSLQFFASNKAAVPALTYAVMLTIVMGLTRQEGNHWLNNMLSFWPFVLTYLYLTIILGLVVLRQLRTWATAKFSLTAFPSSLLSHLGLFIALTTATLGSADMLRVKMVTAKGAPEWRAMDQQGMIIELPFTIELRQFIMETYDDGKPKRYASDILIQDKTDKNIQATIDVNKPLDIDGWKIYQFGYDTRMGAKSQTSIFELVYDPWLPIVYAGIYLLLGSVILMLLRVIPWKGSVQQARKHPKRAILLFTLIMACFICIHHFMPILHSSTLVPALQSPWFVPHIVAYMLAYTLLGAAAVMSVLSLTTSFKHMSVLNNLVYAGLAFMTIGMLFGALWAKEAWGHYWAWDPKETWAAITWFSYLGYIHYRLIPNHKEKLALWMLLISFALLQMCWWGIKFLPAAQESSVHVYN